MPNTPDPQAARDRLFALIASIPGSGTIDWCGPARALLDEIAVVPSAAETTNRATSDAVREQLLAALDFSYCQTVGYDTPEALLAAYDATQSVPPPADRATLLRAADWFDSGVRSVTMLFGHQAATELRRMADQADADASRVAAEEQPTETQRPSCPDPIECGHEAALGEAQQQVRRLGLTVSEYGQGASALTDKLRRVRDMHRRTCPVAQGVILPPVVTCSLCEVLDAPAVAEQPDTQTREAVEPPRVVRCSRAILSRPHEPHGWLPQPGMDPVDCPGHSFTEDAAP